MQNKDQQQLDLLGVFHYIVGGITALFSLMPMIHICIGLMVVFGALPWHNGQEDFPALFGWLFVIMGAVAMVMGLGISVCILIAGTKLRKRRNRVFCMVVAGMECLFMPFGTILGVFTLVALCQDSVKELFGTTQARMTN